MRDKELQEEEIININSGSAFNVDNSLKVGTEEHLETLNSRSHKKFKNELKKDKKQQSKRKSNRFKIILFIFGLLLLISVLKLIFSKVAKRTQKNEKFTPEYAQAFKYQKTIGQDRLLEKTAKSILKHHTWIRNLNYSKLTDIIDTSNMAFLLSGPPGTGKTLFVKALAYKVDILLRKRYLKKTKGEEYIKKLKNEGKYYSTIDKTTSRVQFFYITPSLINDKYVGGSEGNVSELFKQAKNIDKDYFVTFIMFDEAEALFGNRSGNQDTTAHLGCKSELLTQMSQTPSKYSSLFLFAATNLPKMFDPAFRRRFGTEISFEAPGVDERRELILKIYKDADLQLHMISTLVKLTANKTQSYINKKLKSYIDYDENGKFLNVRYNSLIRDLKRNIRSPDTF